jgi:transposase-like protein
MEREMILQCPKCGGEKHTSKGYRYNRSGLVRVRKCKECGRKFSLQLELSIPEISEPETHSRTWWLFWRK